MQDVLAVVRKDSIREVLFLPCISLSLATSLNAVMTRYKRLTGQNIKVTILDLFVPYDLWHP